jgi:hypothetical protein
VDVIPAREQHRAGALALRESPQETPGIVEVAPELQDDACSLEIPEPDRAERSQLDAQETLVNPVCEALQVADIASVMNDARLTRIDELAEEEYLSKTALEGPPSLLRVLPSICASYSRETEDPTERCLPYDPRPATLLDIAPVVFHGELEDTPDPRPRMTQIDDPARPPPRTTRRLHPALIRSVLAIASGKPRNHM